MPTGSQYKATSQSDYDHSRQYARKRIADLAETAEKNRFTWPAGGRNRLDSSEKELSWSTRTKHQQRILFLMSEKMHSPPKSMSENIYRAKCERTAFAEINEEL